MKILNLLPNDIKEEFKTATLIQKSFVKQESGQFFTDILLSSSNSSLYIIISDDKKTKQEICDEFLFASMSLLNSEYSNSLVYIKHRGKLTEASDFFR